MFETKLFFEFFYLLINVLSKMFSYFNTYMLLLNVFSCTKFKIKFVSLFENLKEKVIQSKWCRNEHICNLCFKIYDMEKKLLTDFIYLL